MTHSNFIAVVFLVITLPCKAVEFQLLDFQSYADCSEKSKKSGNSKTTFEKCVHAYAKKPIDMNAPHKMCATRLNPNPQTCLGIQPIDLKLNVLEITRHGPGILPVEDKDIAPKDKVFIEINVDNNEAATVRFNLIDRQGRMINRLRMMREQKHDSDKFIGYIEMPSVAFTVQTSGVTLNGIPYTHDLGQLVDGWHQAGFTTRKKQKQPNGELERMEEEMRQELIDHINSEAPQSGVFDLQVKN